MSRGRTTHIHRSALLPYSAEQLFDMVNDVARYPEFLPWCEQAAVLKETDELLEAQLLLAARGMKEILVTRNALTRPNEMVLTLVEGPFTEFRGFWEFTDLGDAQTHGCKVELELSFRFSSGVMGAAFGAVFSRLASTLVDAFCERAHVLYG